MPNDDWSFYHKVSVFSWIGHRRNVEYHIEGPLRNATSQFTRLTEMQPPDAEMSMNHWPA